MLNIVSNNKNSKCSISLAPQSTNKALSKMKMPTIPSIAVNALNILNNANYSHLHNNHSR